MNKGTKTNKSFQQRKNALQTFDKKFWVIFFSFVVFIIVVLFFPYLITSFSWFKTDFSNTGQIGDTLGGIMGPFIAIAAAILTFFAFWVQYKANEQQKKDLQKERFENRFFEMIRLHKENINEINIQGYEYITEEEKEITPFRSISRLRLDSKKIVSERISTISISGRNAINDINIEIRACYEICADLILKKEISTINNEKLNVEAKKRYIFKMAYTFVFLGAETDTIHFIDTNIEKDDEYIEICRTRLLEVKDQYEDKCRFIDLLSKNDKVNLNIKFQPFEGHSSQLGHYFRHLFQSVKYVIKQDEGVISYSDKREYLGLLRGQLSNQEQLLLYLNYLGRFGAKWEDNENKFFTDYRMIHNMPVLEAEYCISPLIEFKEQRQEIKLKNEELFEQEENQQNNAE